MQGFKLIDYTFDVSTQYTAVFWFSVLKYGFVVKMCSLSSHYHDSDQAQAEHGVEYSAGSKIQTSSERIYINEKQDAEQIWGKNQTGEYC